MANSQTSSVIARISQQSARRFTKRLTPTRAIETFAPQDDANIALETYINSLQLDKIVQLTDEEQERHLKKIDALELFHALQEIDKSLAMVRLENHYLGDFLEKNDPKLLIGLEQRRSTVHHQIVKRQLSLKDGGSSLGTRSRVSISRSVLTTTMSTRTSGSQKKLAYDYKLNYRAKTDMAEKMAYEVERRVHEMEKVASHEIKLLCARIEELNLMSEDTQKTTDNFELHFLRDPDDLEFLNTATEREIERKLRKFVNQWIRNARALLATMRLKITSTQEHCQQLRNELLTKADLAGVLSAVDFENLQIKREELLNSLEEKTIHMDGLKRVSGKASNAMTEEKQIVVKLEEESKQLNNKSIELANAIGKLEKETTTVAQENERDMKKLTNLKLQLERFEAPSIKEYMEKKNEAMSMEKEEKILRRKLFILKMKLDNMKKKCPTKKGEEIIINHMK